MARKPHFTRLAETLARTLKTTIQTFQQTVVEMSELLFQCFRESSKIIIFLHHCLATAAHVSPLDTLLSISDLPASVATAERA